MPDWRLIFPIYSLDDRINMRAAVARLQADRSGHRVINPP